VRKQFVKAVGYLLDYGPIILTVLAATTVSVLATSSSITIEQLVQSVLLVLALLATTQLIDRFRLLRNLDQKVDTILVKGINDKMIIVTTEKVVEIVIIYGLAQYILENSASKAGIDQLFLDRKPSLVERLQQAKTIDHNGITLVGTSNNMIAVFTDCVTKGGRIRLLMVDPSDKALEVAAQRFLKHQDSAMFRREAEHALDNFSSIYKEPKSKNNFKIGFVHIVPPYSIWVIDANTSRAEVWVSLYSFRDDPEPTLHILPYKDEKYFRFFQRQFELMWQASTSWTPKLTNIVAQNDNLQETK